MEPLRIGVIGDYNPRSPYHPATTEAVLHAAGALGVEASVEWLPTRSLAGPMGDGLLEDREGLIAGPGSPYRSLEGALRGIRFAREEKRPFLGT